MIEIELLRHSPVRSECDSWYYNPREHINVLIRTELSNQRNQIVAKQLELHFILFIYMIELM
jgi:hypothetical protein